MYLVSVHAHAYTFSPGGRVATSPARTASALRSLWRQGRDSSRLTDRVGGRASGLTTSRTVYVLSCVRRASYGSGSRRNGRQGSAISLFPRGWARDGKKIPPWG